MLSGKKGKEVGEFSRPSTLSMISPVVKLCLTSLLGMLLSAGLFLSGSDAAAQTVVRECAPGFIRRITAAEPYYPGVSMECNRLRIAVPVTRGKNLVNVSRANLKFGRLSVKGSSLVKRQCLTQGSDGAAILNSGFLLVDPNCLAVQRQGIASRRVNQKNSGTIDLAKFNLSLQAVRDELIKSGMKATDVDSLIGLIRNLVTGSLVTTTPIQTVTASPTTGTPPRPTTVPISPPTAAPTVATPTRTATASPSPVVTTAPACSGVIRDDTSYPCKDGSAFSIITYPLSCDFNSRPSCPSGYREVHRVCLANGQCQLNCQTSCTQCSSSQIGDDTTTYRCKDGVEYLIRYYPSSCQTSCPAGYTPDHNSCLQSGQCQFNCKRSCTTSSGGGSGSGGGTKPQCTTAQIGDDANRCLNGVSYVVRSHPSTCETSCPAGTSADFVGCLENGQCRLNCRIAASGPCTSSVVPTATVIATTRPSVTPTTIATPTVPQSGSYNRCDSQYVLIGGTGACKFGTINGYCIAASPNNPAVADPTSACMNIQGKMLPVRSCVDGRQIDGCGLADGRDGRCSEDMYRDFPYITSFSNGITGSGRSTDLYCCSQPQTGGSSVTGPSAGVSCRKLAEDRRYYHDDPVSDPNTLQPNQRRDCTMGDPDSAMKNCGVTPNNPYGNGTCGFKTMFGKTMAMSAPIINTYQCCSGRARYVRHIIGGNGPERRKGEHAYYICCGAWDESPC